MRSPGLPSTPRAELGHVQASMPGRGLTIPSIRDLMFPQGQAEVKPKKALRSMPLGGSQNRGSTANSPPRRRDAANPALRKTAKTEVARRHAPLVVGRLKPGVTENSPHPGEAPVERHSEARPSEAKGTSGPSGAHASRKRDPSSAHAGRLQPGQRENSQTRPGALTSLPGRMGTVPEEPSCDSLPGCRPGRCPATQVGVHREAATHRQQPAGGRGLE